MPRDAVGKAILAAALQDEGIMKAEQGKLDDSLRLLDAAQAWRGAARHDAKQDRREAKAARKNKR